MTKPTVFRLRELADWQRGLAKQAVTPTTREMHQELSVCFDAGADAMDQLTAAQQRIAELEDIGRRVVKGVDDWNDAVTAVVDCERRTWPALEELREALRAGQGGGDGR